VTADGLPYVRRDGERNPEIKKLRNHDDLAQLAVTVDTLALTYFYTGDEKYAEKAAALARRWFLEAATRMNPNLEFAQGIPGINTGRGIGIIETSPLTNVVDAIGLLAGSKHWTDADERGTRAWFDAYLTWMRESKNGREEAAAKNNHGSIYDVQVVCYTLFVDKRDVAVAVLREAPMKRIAVQVRPDGTQPMELERTKSWGYSCLNLRALMLLATLADHVRDEAKIDLWVFATPDGRCIRNAAAYLAPFAAGEKNWPHQQLGEWPPQIGYPLMRLATEKYPEDATLRQMSSKLPPLDPADRANLLCPPIVRREIPPE
jgi:hypothetical protein